MPTKKQTPDQTSAPSSNTSATACFDKCLVHITREPMRRGGKSMGRTTAAKIVKIEREAMPASPIIISRLNAANDHQNATDAGFPVIIWYFPAGTVQEKDEFAAKDIYHPGDDMVITGLKIDTSRKLN